MQQILDRIRCQVVAQEDSGLVRLQDERLGMRKLLIGAGEGRHGRAIAAACFPLVLDAELELRNRWGGLDRIDGVEQAVYCYPVNKR